MKDRSFIDTNIFVYSFDSRVPVKRNKAQKIISSAVEEHTGIISYQVVQEFLNVATRKFATPMTLQEAQKYMDMVLRPLCEVYSSMDLYAQALRIMTRYKFSFYDCLIIAAALNGRCNNLISEDLPHDQEIEGIYILNPFLS